MVHFIRRVWHLMRQHRYENDLAEEMEFHRAMKQREFVERGVDPTEARFAVRREVGSVALAQDQSCDVWLPPWLQDTGRDWASPFPILPIGTKARSSPPRP